MSAPAELTGETTPTLPAFHRKSLLRLSWPLLVVTVFTLIATLGNVVLLSQVSQDLNAAVATANQILGITYDVSVIFSLGALVVVAQYLGAGLLVNAQRATVLALRASTVLGAVLALAIAAGAPLFLDWVNTPEDIYADARAYLWVVAGGLLFNAYIVAAVALLRAYGRTVSVLVLGIVVNLLDVATLFVCLFVLELGAVGAALPTLLVRGVGVVLLWWLVKRASGVSLLTPLPARDDSVRHTTWTMARLSIPTVVENSVYNFAIVFAVSFINLLGTDTINARSYALTLTAVVTGVILALAQGNETIVGWDVGERDRRHASGLTWRTAAWTAGLSGALALALWAGADALLAGLFGASHDVVQGAKSALLISALLLPLSAVTAVVYGALRSAGDVMWPTVYSLVTSIAVLAPLSWLFIKVWGWGLEGAFWALVVAEAVKAGLLGWRWLSGRWARIPSVVDQDVKVALI